MKKFSTIMLTIWVCVVLEFFKDSTVITLKDQLDSFDANEKENIDMYVHGGKSIC